MRGTPFLFSGFVGGLNVIDSPYTIEDNESRDCLNVVATTRGAIQKRTGQVQFLSSPPAVELTSMSAVQISGTHYLIAFGGTRVYSISPTGTVTDITGGATITSGTRWSVVQAPGSTSISGQGPVYMSNGIDAPLQWNGSGNVVAWTGVVDSTHIASGVPNGRYMIFHQNRIWMAGVQADMAAVYFSDAVVTSSGLGTGDPSSWPLSNVVRFDSSDGYPLTGIGEVGPYVLVFKEHKSWVITDPATGANRQLQDKIGCVAHRSIVATPLGTLFLTANHGIYVTTGTQVQEAGYKVRPIALNITQTQRANACATLYGNHYYLSMPFNGAPANSITLDYDLMLKAWFLHSLSVNEYAVYEPGGTPLLYAAVPGSGNGIAQCFVPNVFTDLGQPYVGNHGFSAYYYGAWQRFYAYFLRHRNPMPMVKKRVRQVYFNGSGVIVPVLFKNFNAGVGIQQPGVVNNAPIYAPTLPVVFAPNNQIKGNPDTAQVYGGTTYKGIQMLWGGAALVGDARIYAPGVAEEWSVGFGNATADPFEVDAYAYASQTRKS